MSDKTEEKTEPYFHLSKNEHGKMWLMYKPEGDGRYKCWEPINEEFWNEFSKLVTADQEIASLREQKKKDDDEFNRALETIKELEKMYANTHGKLRDLEKEHSDNKANLHRAYKGLERLDELKEQLKQKEDENREIKFVLDNCKSYLEVFKDEWKEGEEMLHSEISRLSAKLGKV